MTIAQIVFRFDAPGGVETNVREVTRRLIKRGRPVHVYASDLEREQPWTVRRERPAEVDGVPVDWFPARAGLFPPFRLPVLLGLIEALDRDRPELLHAHSHRYLHVVEAAVVAERRGIPLVVTTHYHPALAEMRPARRLLHRIQDVGFGMTAYRRARAVIVQTELERRLVSGFVPPDRIRLVPPGVDLAAWRSAAEERPPDGLPETYFLYVGRLAPNKGLPGLLAAYARLDPETRPALVLLGPEWGMGATVRTLAERLGIGDDLEIVDPIAWPPAYRAVVRGARALVLPSEWESFGLVLLEAMAAKTPVVATAVGGVPEALDGGRCGRLVPYGDTDALAAALAAVDSEPERTAAMVDRASAWVEQFDWDRVVDRLLEIYDEAMGRV